MKKIILFASIALLAASCQTRSVSEVTSSNDNKPFQSVPEALDTNPSSLKDKPTIQDPNTVQNEPEYSEKFDLKDWSVVQTNISNYDGIPTDSTIQMTNKKDAQTVVLIRSTSVFRVRAMQAMKQSDSDSNGILYLDQKSVSSGTLLTFWAPGDVEGKATYFTYDVNTHAITKIPTPAIEP